VEHCILPGDGLVLGLQLSRHLCERYTQFLDVFTRVLGLAMSYCEQLKQLLHGGVVDVVGGVVDGFDAPPNLAKETLDVGGDEGGADLVAVLSRDTGQTMALADQALPMALTAFWWNQTVQELRQRAKQGPSQSGDGLDEPDPGVSGMRGLGAAKAFHLLYRLPNDTGEAAELLEDQPLVLLAVANDLRGMSAARSSAIRVDADDIR